MNVWAFENKKLKKLKKFLIMMLFLQIFISFFGCIQEKIQFFHLKLFLLHFSICKSELIDN